MRSVPAADPSRRDAPRGYGPSPSSVASTPRRRSRRGRVSCRKLETVRKAWESSSIDERSEASGKRRAAREGRAGCHRWPTSVIGFGEEFARLLCRRKRRAELEQDLSEILKATIPREVRPAGGACRRPRPTTQCCARPSTPRSTGPHHGDRMKNFGGHSKARAEDAGRHGEGSGGSSAR